MLRSLLFGLVLCTTGAALAQTPPATNPNQQPQPQQPQEQPQDPTSPTATSPTPPAFVPGTSGASGRQISHRIRVSGGVMQGLLLTKVDPIYPADARYANVTGTVVLATTIGTDGAVKEIKAVSGPSMLQPAAMDAVKQWTYKPYQLNGAPVEVLTTVTVNFSMPQPRSPQP